MNAMKAFLPALAISLTHRLAADTPIRLAVREEHIKVLGKDVALMAIKQADGQSGYSPQKDEGFHVEVVNNTKAPMRNSGSRKNPLSNCKTAFR
jgi:hypothetical protein